MRILIDARTGWGSGIGRYIDNTFPLVAAARPAFQFDVLVNEDASELATASFRDHQNVKIITSDIRPFTLREQTALGGLSRGYDLTWFTNYWVPLSWRGRFIATVHDVLHLEKDLFPASRVKRELSRATFRKLARDAAGLSFGSRFSQREFEHRFGTVARSRVHYYGIDHKGWQLFDPNASPPKERLILAVGASKKHKNFDVIFDAWTRVDVPEGWRMVVISPDAKLRSGLDLAALGRGKKPFELLRGISNEQLRDLYSRSAILLMPSLYEGFGLPLMEAMQAGAFCIASPAASMVEIAQGAFVSYVNGRDATGWENAILDTTRMIDEAKFDLAPLLRHNMEFATRYSWAKVAATTVDLIDSVVAD